jgi:hypothetical protein
MGKNLHMKRFGEAGDGPKLSIFSYSKNIGKSAPLLSAIWPLNPKAGLLSFLWDFDFSSTISTPS